MYLFITYKMYLHDLVHQQNYSKKQKNWITFLYNKLYFV